MRSLVILSILLALAAPLGAAGQAEETFIVHCYDVGAKALENRPGVISVSREWKFFKEINHVVYDPQQVSKGQLEDWLRQAGTYIQTQPAEETPQGY